MANKGLKSYTKQINQTIGDVAKVSVNVNKEDANLHILIPLITTLGPNPIDISLIFNYQDINKDKAFGKGCTINTFKDIRAHASSIDVYDADGSSITYYLDKNEDYYSKESPLKVSKGTTYLPGDGDYDTFTIEDQQGNYMYFDENYTWYPATIRNKGLPIHLDGPNMDNNNGAKITFTETSNYMYSRATYAQDDTEKYYVDFIYDSNKRLTNVKHYKESKCIKHLSISYGTNEITVKDEISKDYAKYTFSGNCVTKIIEVLNNNLNNAVETSISYEDRRTTLTDNDGRKVYIYFDKNNFPLFEIDEDGNAIETEFDVITKKLTSQSSVIPTKNQLTTIATPNISMFTKTSGITTRVATVTDSVLSSILNPVFYVSGTGSLTYNIYTKGLGSDTITAVIWGKQWSTYSNSSNVKVTLTVDENDTDVFKKTSTDGNFDMMTLGVTALKSYSKTGQGSVSNVYNSKGLQTRSLGKDSTMFDYEYDNNGNITTAKTAYGGKIENTYDTYNNLTKSVASNAAGTKKLETNVTYENGRFVSSETDELGNKTSYTYDSFGKIKKITDALNATTEYSYDAFDNLTRILFNNSVSVNYTYDSQNNLKTATLPNGTKYSFGYDSSNNLNQVFMNDELLVTFTYDQKTGLIKNQKYGTNGDSYDFIYNTKHNISQIKINGTLKYQYVYDDFDQLIQVKNGGSTVLKSYTYNNDGQLIKAVEGESTIDYGYDSLGEVNRRKRTLSSKTIYESLDSISRSKGFSPDNMIGYLQGDTDYLGTMFLDSAELKNPLYVLTAIDYQTNAKSSPTYTRKKKVPCVHCGLFNPMSYNPPMKNNTEDCGSIGFWFYPTNLPLGSNKKYLFSIKNKTLPCFVAAYFNSSGKLVLETKDSNNVIETRTIDSTIKLNTWNFFGLNFAYRIDEVGTSGGFSFELYHNSKYLKGTISRTIRVGSIAPYHIGYRFDGTKGYDSLECPITALVLGRRFYLSSKQMQDFYSTTKDYILGNSYLDEDSVNFSSTTVYNLSESMLNQFEIYPLQNNVTSLKGKKPVVFDARVVSSTDKDRTFNFNNLSKRCAFMAEGNRLEYDLAMSQTGTILMRAFIKETIDKQYLLECKDSKGYTIGLYREYDTYLSIKVNSSTIKTNLKLPTDIWNTVGISFTEGSISSSTGDQKCLTVRVYLNGNTYTSNIQINTSFDSLTLSVGRRTEKVSIQTAMGTYETCYPMLGQIEMLATRPAYCEVATLNTLSNELKDTTKVSEFDELGMLQKKVIKHKDTDILTNSYTYKKRSSSSIFISKFVEKETIKYGSTTVNRSYGVNALGEVTSVSDTTFGSHSYSYNTRGFLEREDSIEYTYDSNGNITKAGSTIFTYDTTIKDRLKSVNGKEITYGTNPLNPASWNGLKYTFEGRRLTRFTYGGGFVNFEYNDQGLRTVKKDYRGIGSKYFYDGDLLITEIAPGYRLDFLYDENNQLYGFIYNNSDKYFYIRDFMQNILGIIDTSGNLVVKYGYTAYGTITDISGSLAGTIGAHNPFRYKGYYYDTETSMYYCKSRYYVPEWCRWLNGDNIVCFKAQTINGMNLFSYCQNNPITYVDENGNMPTWAKWLVGGLVLAGAVAATVLTGGASIAVGAAIGSGVGAILGIASGITLDENGWSFDSEKAANGFMLGSITGAISGAVSGGISNGFTFAGHAFEKGSYVIRGIKAGVDGLLAMGSYMTQCAMSGSEISVVGSFISLGTGLLNFVDPMGKIDSVLIPTIGAEIAWGYDMISNAIKKRNQKFSVVY